MNLDVNQMSYLINIVECGCNLTLAAKKIHISQSALSQFIKNFEQDEEVILFNRKNGRLSGLTESGQKIYQYSKEIMEKVEELDQLVRREASKQKGTVRLGVPSLILRVYLATFIPNFTLNFPDIQFEVTENGCHNLRKMLINNDIDLAFLIEPTDLDLTSFDQHVVDINEMVAFMDSEHVLNHSADLEWEELKGYPLATFNETFTTNGLVRDKLNENHLDNKFSFLSASWDFLVEATRWNDIVTILPKPIDKYMDTNEVAVKRFKDPIPFNVYLCRRKKETYSDVEDMLLNAILDMFYAPVD
ncbi:LysR family transcriptional regulator [Fundicoccus culcitae]|uniref:LysR family transcriptional regulator n=1 Tax=Fundicoccus culcitae TaxID=2969821 RepID=A0ABY5P4B6_9LACT|nr:LysR family transcriptional regulator [Fundicoccus culcitae]UUX33421.1 LysR family transcriptional regulator [Fundicoccus culcitae]